VNDYFGIGIGAKDMPPASQLFSQLSIVINFSIKYDPNRAVFIGNRLVASIKVYDRESAETEPNWT
jgi:hypothetical protein